MSKIIDKPNAKTFKNKNELVDFVKNQLNVTLENDKTDRLNQKRNILYTQIPGALYSNEVLRLFNKYGIKYEKHLKDYYWVWIK